jgi:hypothetical protein
VFCSGRVHNAGVPDVIVTPDEDESPPAVDLALQGAHDAAVAEGGAQVREELAAESADEAKAAAAVALEVAQQNAETAQQVIEATGTAEAAAEQAQVTLELIHEQQAAMSQAIAALAEELKAGRASQVPAEPKKTGSERPPGAGKPRWVRR